MEIKKASKLGVKDNAVFLIATDKDLSLKNFSKEEIIYIKKELKAEHKQIEINRLTSVVYIVLLDKNADYKAAEKARNAASTLTSA